MITDYRPFGSNSSGLALNRNIRFSYKNRYLNEKSKPVGLSLNRNFRLSYKNRYLSEKFSFIEDQK